MRRLLGVIGGLLILAVFAFVFSYGTLVMWCPGDPLSRDPCKVDATTGEASEQ